MNAASFRWIFCSMLSILTATIPETVSARVIYGLEQAKHFDQPQGGPFFVQAGAFLSKKLAQDLQRNLRSITDYPINIRPAGKFYAVVIGPLPSLSAVRSIGGVHASQNVNPPPRVIRQELHEMPRKPASKWMVAVPNTNRAGSWFADIDLGVMQGNASDSLTVANGSDYPPPLNVDNYSKGSTTPVMLGLQVGHRWQRDAKWVPAYALALRYQHLFVSDVKGSITQYSLPEYNNYSYRWGVESNVLSLYSKFDLAKYGRVMPYVDVGLGLSINRSISFEETAYPGITPRISPDFGAKASTQFAYNVGAGLDFVLSSKLLLSVGYDYQQFGSMTSGPGKSTWSGERLSLGNFTGNTALVGMTYLIDGASSNVVYSK